MGRWNRRYLPRSKYNYQYQDFPPNDYDDKFDSAIQENNSVPLWEIEFCKSVGIPWHKIISTKKYISCHDSVVTWDDSASREAFRDAKTRFWAKTNGLPCDNPLPDPCKYVDEVDWNVMIDPEMILDLDRDFFNPDEAKDISGSTLSQDDKNRSSGENGWEGNETVKAGQSCDPWNESKISRNFDPWEENCTKTGGGAFKGTGWRSVGNDSSWGLNSWQNGTSGTDNAWNNSWNHDGGNVGCTWQKEWGDNKNGSWSQNPWTDRDHNGFQTRNTWIDRDHKPWNSANHYDPRENNAFRGNGATNREGSRQRQDNSRSWNKSGFQSNHHPTTYLEQERYNTGRESFYGGSKKRESSSYHTSTFKSSRFQGEEHRAAYDWRKVKNSEEYK